MNTRSISLFVSCILFLVFAPGCYSAGGGYSLREESPWHEHTIEESTDARGQTTTVETRIVKPQANSMGYGASMGYGPMMGSGTGFDNTDAPYPITVRCVEVLTGEQAGQIICPRIHGVVPMTEAGPIMHTERDDPVRAQVVELTRWAEEVDACIQNNTCRPVQ